MFFLFLHGIGPWYVLFFPLVLDSTCFLLSFAVSQKYRHVFSERVDSKFNGNSAIPPLDPREVWTPRVASRDLGKRSPLSLAESGKSGRSRWNPTRWDESHGWRTEDFGEADLGIFPPPGWHAGDHPKTTFTSQFLDGGVGSILSWILPSFFCVLDFDSWSKDPVLWQVILKVWVMNRARKGWCIYYISLKLIVIWSSSSTACH